MLANIMIILQAVCSLALIVVIMLQSGKEEGLSGALVGSSNSYMNQNKKGGLDSVLASSTKWIALVWIILTLTLSLI